MPYINSDRKSAEDYYTAAVVQSIVLQWRKPGQRSICNFCRLFGTTGCPHQNEEKKPEEGFSEKFIMRATTQEEADALFSADAEAAGKPFKTKIAA